MLQILFKFLGIYYFMAVPGAIVFALILLIAQELKWKYDEKQS